MGILMNIQNDILMFIPNPAHSSGPDILLLPDTITSIVNQYKIDTTVKFAEMLCDSEMEIEPISLTLTLNNIQINRLKGLMPPNSYMVASIRETATLYIIRDAESKMFTVHVSKDGNFVVTTQSSLFVESTILLTEINNKIEEYVKSESVDNSNYTMYVSDVKNIKPGKGKLKSHRVNENVELYWCHTDNTKWIITFNWLMNEIIFCKPV